MRDLKLMNKKDVEIFFDACAPKWDEEMIRHDDRITKILNYAQINSGVKVLDVACGTGVLFNDYLSRNVEKVTAVDLSKNMIEIAKAKFNDSRIELIHADIEELELGELYDRCVVYNAFPHFLNPQNLIVSLYHKLKSNGRLTIAHGMSREMINAHHREQASRVSIGLMSVEELSSLLKPLYDVDIARSDNEIYVVSAIKR